MVRASGVSAHPFVCGQENTSKSIAQDIRYIVNGAKYGPEYGACYLKLVRQAEVLRELYRNSKDENCCWKPRILFWNEYPQEKINDGNDQYISNVWPDKVIVDKQCDQYLNDQKGQKEE